MKLCQNHLIIFVALILNIIGNMANAQTAEEAPVVIAYQIDREANFLNEPGNNSIEILRRLGRSLNSQWVSGKVSLLAASLFDAAQLGGPKFLSPQPEIRLSKNQQEAARAMLTKRQAAIEEQVAACHPASEALIIRAVCESENLIKSIKGSFAQSNKQNGNNGKAIALERAEKELMPILEASDFMAGALVVSKNGCYGKIKVFSESGKLGSETIKHDISIGKYINHDALMLFCQTHPIEDPAEAFKKINEVPQSSVVISMIASAGIDFEKDILANTARESVLYINLEPSGDGGIPDIRFVAPVPDIARLRANLDKFKALCQQTGIFVQALTGDFPMVKLSYFMWPQAAIYAGLYDRFLVLASAQTNLAKELKYLKDIDNESQKTSIPVEKVKRYWKIQTRDFNLQLQKLLQSPMLASRGIPPITNLTFLDDIKHFLLTSRASAKTIEFSLEIPIKESVKTKH